MQNEQLPVVIDSMVTVYSEHGFWRKMSRYALSAGRQVVEKALWLYFAAERPETPTWAKATVYGSLAYFVLPVDAVPDITPIAGYADDLGVLTFAVATIARYINADCKQQASALMQKWF